MLRIVPSPHLICVSPPITLVGSDSITIYKNSFTQVSYAKHQAVAPYPQTYIDPAVGQHIDALVYLSSTALLGILPMGISSLMIFDYLGVVEIFFQNY